MDLELNIVQVKDNLKKAEAGPVTLGTTVDTTHLENVSPQVSARSHGSSELLDWSRGEGGGSCLPPLAQTLLSPVTTAQSCCPRPRLYPSQLCNGAQEQTSFRHGHGQRHCPPESQGKWTLPASFKATSGQQNGH